MPASLSEERFKAFLNCSEKYYSWEKILQDAGITEFSDKGDQLEVTCPFHADKRPSLRLTKRNGVYHCFSCGRKGTYTRFIWELQGQVGSYSGFCEQVLKARPEMQAELRFNSLFITSDALDPAFNARRVFKISDHIGSEMPITTLVSKVKKVDNSWESLAISMTLLQQGVKTDSILAVMKKQHIDVEVTAEELDLLDIIGGD